MSFLRIGGIIAIFHYLSLHYSIAAIKYSIGVIIEKNVADFANKNILRLPMFNTVLEKQKI